MINVLVVDDSAFMRKMISEILEKHSRIHVVDKARNGRDAVEKVAKLNPDVVTMDVEMPVLSGLEALKEIMATNPKPVIMVSSITKEGAEATIKAMEYGAFDFISKPSGSISLDIHKVERDLTDKVLQAANVRVDRLIPGKAADKKSIAGHDKLSEGNHEDPGLQIGRQTVLKTVVIGTSTGGPKALQHVLPALPASFPYPVLIVQHMPPGFTKSLSERLNTLSAITVKEAQNGEILKKGIAYIAPGGYHLKVRGIGTSVAIHLDQSEPVNGHRPSVDVLFKSQTDLKLDGVTAVIMTGMGSDGKKGLQHLKEHMRTTAIAESEKTAVVYGMPRAAVETALVDHISDLDELAESIIKYS